MTSLFSVPKWGFQINGDLFVPDLVEPSWGHAVYSRSCEAKNGPNEPIWAGDRPVIGIPVHRARWSLFLQIAPAIFVNRLCVHSPLVLARLSPLRAPSLDSLYRPYRAPGYYDNLAGNESYSSEPYQIHRAVGFRYHRLWPSYKLGCQTLHLPGRESLRHTA